MGRPNLNADWPEIERRYKAGEPERQIAKKHGVSHTAIQKRRKKEGWQRANGNYGNKAIAATKTARMAVEARTQKERMIVAYGVRTPGNAEKVLSKLEEGVPYKIAAQCIGVTEQGLDKWRKDDPEFDMLCRVTRGECVSEPYMHLMQGSRRGDIKASVVLLQSAPETRSDFAGAAGNQGATLNVQINVRRACDVQPAVDIAPEHVAISTVSAGESLGWL